MAGYVQRILRGIGVDDETVATNVIAEVAHGGNYVGHEHTYHHFRQEQYFATISDRKTRGAWEAASGRDIYQRATETAREVLAEHHPDPLPEDIKRDLEEEVAAIYKREGIKYTAVAV